jgi:hypothetical protein
VIWLLSRAENVSKGDVKSLLSVSLAAMDQSSTSKVAMPLEVYVDIRDD